MPFIDPEAATLVRALREARGLSPEALAREITVMAAGEGWTRGSVDAYTIRRIEGTASRNRPGRVPSARVAFVVAHYFGMRPHDIWKPSRRVQVPA
jgi:transcriptional regulator with XRE-family HTH domain